MNPAVYNFSCNPGFQRVQEKQHSSQGTPGKFASQEISVVALLLCGLSAFAYSQITSGNVFGGYSHLNANGVPVSDGNGLEGSVEGKILPFISLVGDFSWEFQNPPRVSSAPALVCTPLPGSLPGGCIAAPPPPPSAPSESTFLFGPRASFKIRDFRPFVHALFGGAHTNESALGVAGSSTVFAAAFGGGVDYRLAKQFSWRIQVDAVQTRFFSTSQTNARISTGIVVRF